MKTYGSVQVNADNQCNGFANKKCIELEDGSKEIFKDKQVQYLSNIDVLNFALKAI